jgi:beta-xylosidase
MVNITKRYVLPALLCLAGLQVSAQQKKATHSEPAAPRYVSKVWVADQGNGTYKNPILNADYSDPDAIRVGNDFYLVSSSFEDVPGLPILHSKDLVNWELIGHALMVQPPTAYYSTPHHGEGVWAPSIRYYHNEFYVYYPDINYGIYVTKANNPAGPWSEPVLVCPGLGFEDPCPLIDDDGQMYLVHAFAGSKAGIKSIIAVNKLNAAGTKVTDVGVIVYDGHQDDPTIEGPKFYKRNGYYYIFAPAGGVSSGWQMVLRSKNIYGPYERRVVMDQGKSATNGPHQGAWVTTQTGEDWFIHFQDRDAYGRVTHLEPMQWKNDWPVIGIDKDGDGKGEPVSAYRKPNVGKTYPIQTPAESDEFNGHTLGLQWQWLANPQVSWYYMYPAQGSLRLFSYAMPDGARNLWGAGNVLLQKFPADEFMVTTKMSFQPNTKLESEKAGLAIMGMSYANIGIRNTKDGNYLVYGVCKNANNGGTEDEKKLIKLASANIYLRVKVTAGAKCSFSYSTDGINFTSAGDDFKASVGRWVGAKVGLFCTCEGQTNDAGYADFDWFRLTPITK